MSHLELELLDLKASLLSLVLYLPKVTSFQYLCLASSLRRDPDLPKLGLVVWFGLMVFRFYLFGRHCLLFRCKISLSDKHFAAFI